MTRGIIAIALVVPSTRAWRLSSYHAATLRSSRPSLSPNPPWRHAYSPQMCSTEDSVWSNVNSDLEVAVRLANNIGKGEPTSANANTALDNLQLASISRLEAALLGNDTRPSAGRIKRLTNALLEGLTEAGTKLSATLKSLDAATARADSEAMRANRAEAAKAMTLDALLKTEAALNSTRAELAEGRKEASTAVDALDEALEKAQDQLFSTERALRAATAPSSACDQDWAGGLPEVALGSRADSPHTG